MAADVAGNNVWSFPARDLPYGTTLAAMKSLAVRLAAIVEDCGESARLALPVPIPKLAVLVTASPFDAALHDACGKALQRSSFRTLSPDLIDHGRPTRCRYFIPWAAVIR